MCTGTDSAAPTRWRRPADAWSSALAAPSRPADLRLLPMADPWPKQTIIQLEDDLDCGAAARSLGFAIDGNAREINVNSTNADKLAGVFGSYSNTA